MLQLTSERTPALLILLQQTVAEAAYFLRLGLCNSLNLHLNAHTPVRRNGQSLNPGLPGLNIEIFVTRNGEDDKHQTLSTEYGRQHVYNLHLYTTRPRTLVSNTV